MRILIIIPYFIPAWGYGGPPKIVYHLATLLAKKHQVTVLTTDALDKDQRVELLSEQVNQIQIKRYQNISNYLAWHFKIFLPKKFNREIEHYIKQSDFIYLSDFRDYQNACALKYLLKYKKPYSLAVFGQLPNYFGIKFFFKKVFDICFGKRLVQQAKYIITQTNHESAQCIKYGAQPKQIKLITLAEENSINNPGDRINFRKKYQIPEQTKLLLWVGRINKLKGLNVLLESVDQLKSNPALDFKLIIIGRDDGYANQLAALIKTYQLAKYIILTGPLYGADNAAAYAAADLFVFTPIFYEETSLAAIRALSFGVPVITVWQSEIPYLEEYRAGYLVNCQVKLIAEKLTHYLENDKLMAEYKQNAGTLFKEKYSLLAMEKKYAELLKTI